MKPLDLYSLPFVGLKEGEHFFEYTLDDEFFNEFENSIIKKANLTINVIFFKKSSFMKLVFKIDGTANLICDRCSDFFDLELIDDHEIIVKFERERHSAINNDDTDIIFISNNDTEIKLAQLFYEYVTLSIPLKQACRLNEMEEPSCGKSINFGIKEVEKEIKEEKVDPRWAALNKIKFKK